jgi:multidrug transporter EmrE-like cation transporter
MMGYLYISGTVVFIVYSQLIIKWRITKFGTLPETFTNKVVFLVKSIFDPFIMSGVISAFIASLLWMAAMTKFELSHAYPIIIGGLAILTSIFAIILFNESFGLMKIIGLTLIVAGLYCLSRG